MAGAEESIQLRTYLFDNDDYAIRIADLLKERLFYPDFDKSVEVNKPLPTDLRYYFAEAVTDGFL